MAIKEYLSLSDAIKYLNSFDSLINSIDDLQQLERMQLIKPAIYLSNIYLSDDIYVRNFISKPKVSGYFSGCDFIVLDRLDAGLFESSNPPSHIEAKPSDEFNLNKLTEVIFQYSEIPKQFYLYYFNTNTGKYCELDKIPVRNILIKKSELDEIVGNASDNEKQLNLEIEHLKHEIEQLRSNQSDDNKPMHHKSKATVRKILYALAELSKKDNSSPYSQNKGSLNEAVTTILQNAGIPLEYEAVGNWLNEVKAVSPPNKN